MEEKKSFLDKSSLMAIVLLGLSWVAWDAYMKKKYPRSLQPKTTEEQELQSEEQKPKIKKTRAQSFSGREKKYKYSGEKVDIVFSSKGFGVSEFTLKDFSDRKGRPIVFKNTEQPLFSTQFLQTEAPIPFKISKKGLVYRGIYQTNQLRLVKTIEIDEDKFLLNTKIEIQQKKGALEGLSMAFSQNIPPETTTNGFVKMLTAYGQDMFKGFVLFSDKRNLFTEPDLEKEEKTYPHFSVGALGGKYFGVAFVNKSKLQPTMRVKKQKKIVIAKADYAFLSEKSVTLNYLAFLGPKSSDSLKELDEGAKRWIDFGFFSWLAHPLLVILKSFYRATHNWGLAIMLLTFFIRLCLLPINIKSYRSMKIMQTIQPKIKELREAHKKDPKKLNVEIMALMKENKASPFGGCLPLFFQFPVFFALYRVLGESIELYQAPFVFWVGDLSLKDPYYVLPVLAGLTLFVQQKITPMNVPPAQARLLTFMPLLFSVFMLSLPSGLTLYIFVSGVFGLVQQGFFMKFKKQ